MKERGPRVATARPPAMDDNIPREENGKEGGGRRRKRRRWTAVTTQLVICHETTPSLHYSSLLIGGL